MRIGSKLLAGVLGLVVICVVGVKVFQNQISSLLLDRMLEQNVGRDVMDTMPDGLHVGLCGSAGPLPNRDRGAACVFVIAGGDLYVIDAGSGSSGNIGSMGLDAGRIKGIFLTHFHSDHIDGLGELMMNRWVRANHTASVPVYGPQGVSRVVAGLNDAYALDATYRTAHHGEDIAPPSGRGGEARAFALGGEPDASAIVLEHSGLKVTAFRVDHAPIHPAVGYRFDYKGRSVVISGDTAPSASLVSHARGADVLVHETLQKDFVERFEMAARKKGMDGMAKIMFDIRDYHTSPEQAADIASEAGVDHLLLYHIVPPVPGFMDKLFLGDAKSRFDGPITMGTDGFLIILPAGSDDMETRSLL